MERERTARMLNCNNCDNIIREKTTVWYSLLRCKLTGELKNEWDKCRSHSVIVESLKHNKK